MATTTNYGWTTPDDTALVKDGAAAIRSLGTAIDTTTYNNAQAAIAKTIVDAKGDLIVGTAADTVARLASSASNGDLLTVDTSTASGLKWAAPAASGFTFDTWTPTWTRLTVGNGTVIARYGQSGKFVFVDISIQFGSTTSITGNSPEFTLPVNALVTNRPPSYYYDLAIALDEGNQVYYVSVGETDSTSKEFWGSPAGARSILSATSPFTFGTGDCLSAHFVYEAA